ncbi:MAG: GNAT family N-acetyltransferase, partial [Deltaproteobacteria bacterium]|nr:GNAT family N-acetyltransferase [Deltaproteobacteria bacterium]
AHAGTDSPLNKVAGLGFHGTVDETGLAEIEQIFAHRGTPVQVELSTLADPEIGRMLTRRGYLLQGFEHVLGLQLSGVDPPTTQNSGLEIAQSSLTQLDVWLDTIVSGFAAPDGQGVATHEEFPRDALERVMADMAVADGSIRFIARRGDAVAGGATLRIHDGTAQLCGAATLPAHRRQGVQTALLTARLAHAAAAGCDLAVVTTLPGSQSHHNVQRRGFSLLYARAMLLKTQGN